MFREISGLVRRWLSVIAYNLENLCRHLALPQRIDGWSLTSLHKRLVKTGGRLVKHTPAIICCRWRRSFNTVAVRGHSPDGSRRCPYPQGWRADDRMGLQRRERHGEAKCRRHRSKTGRLRSLRFPAEATGTLLDP